MGGRLRRGVGIGVVGGQVDWDKRSKKNKITNLDKDLMPITKGLPSGLAKPTPRILTKARREAVSEAGRGDHMTPS